MISVVLDANVLAAGFVGAASLSSTPGELIRRWRSDEYVVVVSDHILSELELALSQAIFRAETFVESD